MKSYYIKLSKQENYIILNLYFPNNKERYKRYSSRFYLTKENFIKSLTQDVIEIDISNTLSISNHNNMLYYKFIDFLNNSDYSFILKTQDILDWYNSNKEHKLFIPENLKHKKPSKIVITEYAKKTMKEIIENKLVKNHFRKAIMNLVDYMHDEIVLYSDCKYSFGFSKYNNKKLSYNGGLIYHNGEQTFTTLLENKVRKNPYSIHT